MATEHASRNDIGQRVVVHVGDYNLPTNTRCIIDHSRNPLHILAGSLQFKPIDNGASIPIRSLAMMGPIRFARNDVFQAVPVDVCQSHRMKL